MSTTKDEIIRIVREQPDTSSSEEIVRELAFHLMVQRGLTDADSGNTISHQEMGSRIRQWQR